MKKRNQWSTIGVRYGSWKMYTYKIKKGVKVHLGQELVVDSPSGPAVVFVVRIDKKVVIPCGYTIETLKEVSRKVVDL